MRRSTGQIHCRTIVLFDIEQAFVVISKCLTSSLNDLWIHRSQSNFANGQLSTQHLKRHLVSKARIYALLKVVRLFSVTHQLSEIAPLRLCRTCSRACRPQNTKKPFMNISIIPAHQFSGTHRVNRHSNEYRSCHSCSVFRIFRRTHHRVVV